MSNTLSSRSLLVLLFALPAACGGSDPETGTHQPPPQLDARVADCLRINACEAAGGEPMGLQICLGHPLDAQWGWATVGPARLDLMALDCKLAAKDCAAVRACTPPKASFATACAANPAADLCDGNTWVFCDELGAPLRALDCGAAGLTCRKDIWAGCGKDPCQFGVTKPTCAQDDADVLVECDASGSLRRIDCRTQNNMVNINSTEGEKKITIAGETCGFDPQRNDIGCIGKGEACSFFSQACNGTVLETCAGGKIGRRDCASLDPAGQGCGFVQSGEFAGGASCGLVGGSCDMGSNEACDGTKLTFCDYGTPSTIDCKVQGFSGCATAKVGERTVAYCAP
ncbi:MAG: hypothetical protein QM820_45100 [Minicystis sp.]